MVTVYAITDNKVEEITFEKETAKFYINRIYNGRKYTIRLDKSRSGYYKTAEDAIQARISYLESKIEDANKEIAMLKIRETEPVSIFQAVRMDTKPN